MKSSPATVLLISHEFAPFRGGVATYVQEVFSAARRLGIPAVVWTVNYKGWSGGHEAESKFYVNESSADHAVVRLSSSGRLTPGGLFSLAWELWRRRGEWREQPLVLLSVGAQMAFFLLNLVGCRTGARVTCLFHGSEILRFRRNVFWRWLATRFYRRETRVFGATTRYVEGLLRASRLLPEDAEIMLAPCALPGAFHVEQSIRSTEGEGQITAENEPEATLRVLTVARLHPRKGQREVAHALAMLPEELRRRVVYQMVGVGEESYRREIESACHVGGVRCEFLGSIDDASLGAVYARASVYAQASRTLAQSVEGFGITFLEAAAHGCPAAAWRSGGVAEAVLDGETGLLAEEGDASGLSKALARLLSDSELRWNLGKKGREHARRFRWDLSARVLCRDDEQSAAPRASLD